MQAVTENQLTLDPKYSLGAKSFLSDYKMGKRTRQSDEKYTLYRPTRKRQVAVSGPQFQAAVLLFAKFLTDIHSEMPEKQPDEEQEEWYMREEQAGTGPDCAIELD